MNVSFSLSSQTNSGMEFIFKEGKTSATELVGISKTAFLPMDENAIQIAAMTKDINNKEFGFFHAKLDRDVMKEGKHTLKFLLGAMFLVTVFTLGLLLTLIHTFVVKRLVSLNQDIASVEGDDSDNKSAQSGSRHFVNDKKRVQSQGGDEIGCVASALNSMLEKIEQRNNALKEIILNVKSGFLMVNSLGKVAQGYTVSCEKLLDQDDLENRDFAEVLFSDKRSQENFSLLLSQVFDDVLPEEFVFDQLPQQTQIGDKWISFLGSIVRDESGKIKSVLFTMSDITELRKAEVENSRIQSTLKILKSRNTFDFFISEVPNSIRRIESQLKNHEGNKNEVRMVLHTIKGNFAMFGVDSIAKTIHRIEDSLEIEPKQIKVVENSIVEFLDSQREILGLEYGKKPITTIQMGTLELYKFVSDVQKSKNMEEVQKKVFRFAQDSKQIAAREALASLVECAQKLANRLGKHVEIQVKGGEVKVDFQAFHLVFESLINAVRNSLDHGFELPHERGKKGEVCHLTFEVAYDGADNLILSLEDDGRGVDFAKLGDALERKGRCSPERFASLSNQEKLEFLFEGDLSTTETVSDISGRGMGMAGIRKEARVHGGDAKIESKFGVGTKVIVTLPHEEVSSALQLAS